jgi:hypothetical protein
MNQIKQASFILCLILLVSCSSNDSNFRAECNGKKITYANQVLGVEKESRKYRFIGNSLEGSSCSFSKGIIFCYKETLNGGIRTKQQLTFDRGYYTMTDIETSIAVGKNDDPVFSKTEVYQANCPMTILPADTK